MNAPYSSSTVLVSVVAATLVLSCDDFTCADYATCEPPDIVSDSGKPRVDSATTAGSADAGELETELPGAGSADSALHDSDAVSSSTLGPHDSGVSAAGLPIANDSGTTNAEGDGEATLRPGDASGASSDGAAADTTAEVSTTGATTGDGFASKSFPPDSGHATSEPEQRSTTDQSSGGEVRCDPTKPFGRPFAIENINLDGEVEHLMVTPDGLTMHIRYGEDLTTYVATREALFEDFGIPQPYAGFEAILEQEPTLQPRSITADGLTVYLSSSTWGDWVQSSHRETISDAFESLLVHDELNAFDMPFASPWITPTGTRIYGFLPAAYTIWAADLQTNTFSDPIEVVGSSDSSVFEGTDSLILSASETVLYFTASSLNDESFQNPVIARADRPSADDSFRDWQVMHTIDGPFYDVPLWVSEDDCEIILEQQVQSGGPEEDYTSDIFVARRGS